MANKLQKPALKAGRPPEHGVYSFLEKGKMPSIRGIRKVRKYADELEQDLKDYYGNDKGELTPGQEMLIRSTMQSFKVQLLVELHLNKIGIPMKPAELRRGVLELQPVLAKSYLAYANTVRQNILALEGLQAREKDTGNIVDIGRKLCSINNNQRE